jgi:hypothetical protein
LLLLLLLLLLPLLLLPLPCWIHDDPKMTGIQPSLGLFVLLLLL